MRWQPRRLEPLEGVGEALLNPTPMERWVRMVDRLPQVRLDRVVAARAAVQGNRYDDDGIFEAALDRLGSEAGINGRL